MKHFKLALLPLAFLMSCTGCSCSNQNTSAQNGEDGIVPINVPINIPIHNPDPGNPPAPVSAGTTMQLVSAGFQSADSGNQTYQSDKYQAHGHIRFVAGNRQTGSAYESFSSDIFLSIQGDDL